MCTCTMWVYLFVCSVCVPYVSVLYDFVCHLRVHLCVWSVWVCGQWTVHWVISGNTSRLKTKQKLVLSLCCCLFWEGGGVAMPMSCNQGMKKKKEEKKKRLCFHFVWCWNPTYPQFHHPKVHLCCRQPCISSYPKQQREGSRVLVTQALQPVRVSVTISIVHEKPKWSPGC